MGRAPFAPLLPPLMLDNEWSYVAYLPQEQRLQSFVGGHALRVPALAAASDVVRHNCVTESHECPALRHVQIFYQTHTYKAYSVILYT